MCLNKRKINLKTCFCNEFAPSVMSVDCGRCADCNYKCYYGYIVRSWFEYSALQSCSLDNGSFAVLETLTYREDVLPKFQGIPCFSAKDITNFIKRLKEYWRRVLGKPLHFSYMVVCEYGGDKCRPHYHIIFFVYDSVKHFDFAKSVADCWQLGSTNFISEYGKERFYFFEKHVLTSFAAVRYTLKYLFKYRDFDNKCQSILDSLSARYSVEASKKIRDDYRYECRPFIRTSVGYGFLSSKGLDLLSSDSVQVPLGGTKFQQLPLPSYIIRKLCTQKVIVLDEFGEPMMRPNGKPCFLKTENGSYVYMRTPLGVDYSVSTLPRLIFTVSQRIYQILTLFPQSITRTFYSFLDGRSVRDLAVYSVVYRGRLVDKNLNLFSSNLLDPAFYTDFYRKCLSRNPQISNEFDSSLQLFDNYKFLDEMSFTEFRDFDLLCDCIDLQSYMVDILNDKKTPLLDSYKRLHDAFCLTL